MDNKDSRINQIISYLASAAAVAADGVTDVVQSAGNAVGDRYNSVKVSITLNRLQEEQKKLFTEIGRTHFLIQTGAVEAAGSPVEDARGILDRLMEMAEEKQREIDETAAKLNELSGKQVCPACSKTADSDAAYCSACGTKLPEKPEKEETPADDVAAPPEDGGGAGA